LSYMERLLGSGNAAYQLRLKAKDYQFAMNG
jgi:hypothetical protein